MDRRQRPGTGRLGRRHRDRLAALGLLSDAPTSSQVGGSEADAAEEAPRTESKVLDESVRAGKLKWTVREISRVDRLRAYTMPNYRSERPDRSLPEWASYLNLALGQSTRSTVTSSTRLGR